MFSLDCLTWPGRNFPSGSKLQKPREVGQREVKKGQDPGSIISPEYLLMVMKRKDKASQGTVGGYSLGGRGDGEKGEQKVGSDSSTHETPPPCTKIA